MARIFNVLQVDFYLPNHNLLIEFQGQQHYKPVEIFGKAEGFFKTQRNDSIKRNFAIQNNIRLLEISYESINSIEFILSKELNLKSNPAKCVKN